MGATVYDKKTEERKPASLQDVIWGQKLDFHPHLHCIVAGGALSPDGKQWRSPKQRKFLFPVRAVAALFRGKLLAGLRQMLEAEVLQLRSHPRGRLAGCSSWHLRFVVYSSGDNMNRR
jgi:hypothetical protein